MKENPKKSFAFEEDFYTAVMNFIAEDIAEHGELNFNKDYITAMNILTKQCNNHFAGKEYMMSLMEREYGKKKWTYSDEADTNFGQIWESIANRFLKTISLEEYVGWPKGKFEFPDFSVCGISGDYKAILTECYNDTKANRTRGVPIGYIKPDGHASLYKLEDYIRDIDVYKISGVLSDHLKAILVFAIYEYRYDEKTGAKYARILDVIVCPALFCINFNNDGTLSTRNNGITIGFQERNYKFISQKNFGV